MNKSIDIFLNEVKDRISEDSDVRDIDVSGAAVIDKCPFCGESAEPFFYDGGCKIVCRMCRASSRIVTTADEFVLSDMDKHASIVDDNFPSTDIVLGKKLFNKFRVVRMYVTAWWAIAYWNRRES